MNIFPLVSSVGSWVGTFSFVVSLFRAAAIVLTWYDIVFLCKAENIFIMQTSRSIFGCLLLSSLTDKLQSCLSSVCWPEAASAPSCQSGRLRSSDRLLAAIRWLVSHSFLSYTLKILQTSSNIRAGIQMSGCQVPNVGKFFPFDESMSDGAPATQAKNRGRRNRLLCTNCLLPHFI